MNFKNYILPILFVLSTLLGQAQQLFTTAGNSGSATGVQLDYSIGEPIIVTHIHAQHQITQGFQQPLLSNSDPTFTSTPNTTGSLGIVYTYNVAAADTDGDALTFAATTLPSWLTFTDNGNNTATLSGTPSLAGTYPVVLTVDDGNGGTATQSFDIELPSYYWVGGSGAGMTFLIGLRHLEVLLFIPMLHQLMTTYTSMPIRLVQLVRR